MRRRLLWIQHCNQGRKMKLRPLWTHTCTQGRKTRSHDVGRTIVAFMNVRANVVTVVHVDACICKFRAPGSSAVAISRLAHADFGERFWLDGLEKTGALLESRSRAPRKSLAASFCSCGLCSTWQPPRPVLTPIYPTSQLPVSLKVPHHGGDR